MTSSLTFSFNATKNGPNSASPRRIWADTSVLERTFPSNFLIHTLNTQHPMSFKKKKKKQLKFINRVSLCIPTTTIRLCTGNFNKVCL